MKIIRPLIILAPLALSAALPNFRPLVSKIAFAQNVRAPELVGTEWINTAEGAPITLKSRLGKVTVVEFWTFGCSNCLANLPAYANLAKTFAEEGVEVIGVHTPELENERDPKNVAKKVKELGILYPVLIDGKNINWNNYGTRYWPSIYVIDKHNIVRGKWEGELEYRGAGGTAKLTKLVRKLLAEE